MKEGNSVDLSIEVPTEDANIVWHKDGQALDRWGMSRVIYFKSRFKSDPSIHYLQGRHRVRVQEGGRREKALPRHQERHRAPRGRVRCLRRRAGM